MRALARRTQSGRGRRADLWLMLAIGFLLLIGLVIIYSISPVLSHKLLGDVSSNHFLYGQLVHIGVGLVGFVAAANWRFERWQKLLPVLLVLCGLSLLLLLIPGLGVSKNGATRWVDLGLFSFQPVELIKLTLVIYLASRFSRPARGPSESQRRLLLALGVLGLLAILVLFAQRDMGSMMVLVAILFGQFYASGVRLAHVGLLGLIGGGLSAASILLFPHRLARLLTYLDPTQNATTTGYHLNQALIAIGSGGLLGLGIGKSVQVYGYLPEAANDSIFAIIGETLGFLGIGLILTVFGILIYRGLRISLLAPNRNGQLLVLGLVLWIASQAVINVAAMVGLIPLTGIPLPFLSYGGTSLVMVLTAMGIVVNVSKYSQRGLYADRPLGRRQRRTSYAPAYRRVSP